LLNGFEAQEAIYVLSQAVLEPVIRYDIEHSGDLLHTLEVYFRCHGNASQGASVLFLHRNGLLYRLNRIEQLLNVSLSDPSIRLPLELAVHVVNVRTSRAAGSGGRAKED